jgi:hypothetical protein
LEGVDYATAVQVLRDSGQTVNLVVKRRVVLPPTIPAPAVSLITPDLPKNLAISLSRSKKKEDFGVILGCKIYIKEITRYRDYRFPGLLIEYSIKIISIMSKIFQKIGEQWQTRMATSKKVT